MPACLHALLFAVFGSIGPLPAIVTPLGLPFVMACTVANGLYFSLRSRTTARAIVVSLGAQIVWLLAQLLVGIFCFPLSFLNPLYVIVAAFLFASNSGMEFAVLPLIVVVAFGRPIYRLNSWYAEQVLWKCASDFNARVAEHLEGKGL